MPATAVKKYVPPELGPSYLSLVEVRHTNCCGAKIVMPALMSPLLVDDYERPLPSYTFNRWGDRCQNYEKRVRYEHQTLPSDATTEELVEAYRNGLEDLTANAMVRFIWVPARIQEAFKGLIKRRRYFKLVAKRPTGNLYIFCRENKKGLS